MKKLLKKDIYKTIDIDEEDLERVSSKFQLLNFEKKQLLLSPGRISNALQFIEKGLVRVFYPDEQAKEITIQIGMQGMWVNNLYSFLNETPSNCYIQALEPTAVWQVEKKILEDLYQDIPGMERFIRLKIQRAYIALQDRTLNQVHHSAEERYLQFRKNYGGLEELIPQYMIASYLNITAEHLSKIRKKQGVIDSLMRYSGKLG